MMMMNVEIHVHVDHSTHSSYHNVCELCLSHPGNLDRHHYETFKDFGNDTFLLHLDNGRA